jgi:hypothetical protein
MFSHSAWLTFRLFLFWEMPSPVKIATSELLIFRGREQRERLMTVANTLAVIWVVPAPAIGEPRAPMSSKHRCESCSKESRTRHRLDIILSFSSISVCASNQIVVVVISEYIYQGSFNNHSCVRTYAYFCQDNTNFRLEFPKIKSITETKRNISLVVNHAPGIIHGIYGWFVTIKTLISAHCTG